MAPKPTETVGAISSVPVALPVKAELNWVDDACCSDTRMVELAPKLTVPSTRSPCCMLRYFPAPMFNVPAAVCEYLASQEVALPPLVPFTFTVPLLRTLAACVAGSLRNDHPLPELIFKTPRFSKLAKPPTSGRYMVERPSRLTTPVVSVRNQPPLPTVIKAGPESP